MTFPRNDFEAWALPHFSGGDAEAVVALAELDSKGGYRSTEMRAARDAWQQLTGERDGWAESARHFANGQEFYQGIVRQIGRLFGEAARTSGDGSVQDDVPALKVPELVEALAAHVKRQDALLAEHFKEWEADTGDWNEFDWHDRVARCRDDKPPATLASRDAKQQLKGAEAYKEALKDATNPIIWPHIEGAFEVWRNAHGEQADTAREGE